MRSLFCWHITHALGTTHCPHSSTINQEAQVEMRNAVWRHTRTPLYKLHDRRASEQIMLRTWRRACLSLSYRSARGTTRSFHTRSMRCLTPCKRSRLTSTNGPTAIANAILLDCSQISPIFTGVVSRRIVSSRLVSCAGWLAGSTACFPSHTFA